MERVEKKRKPLSSTSCIDFHASHLFLKLHKHTIQPVDRNPSNNSARNRRHAFPSRDTHTYVNNNLHQSQVQRVVVSWRSLGARVLVPVRVQGFEERLSSGNGSMQRDFHESRRGRGEQREFHESPCGHRRVADMGYDDGR